MCCDCPKFLAERGGSGEKRIFVVRVKAWASLGLAVESRSVSTALRVHREQENILRGLY